ncbi:MAG: ATP-binding cassette domain-containing protein [Deltaproteobacteria bacterium]|nr:ATP-binding cassette domain-containing protein [Deltaproteobacteria bacterium]
MSDATPQNEPVVEIRNLRAGYGEKVIVSDVSFAVPRGRIVCLIGGSGCGKSTVVRTLTGQLRPMAGEVRVFGQNPHSIDEAGRIALLRRMGMMFQAGALLGSMSVGDNIALPYREHTQLPDAIIRRIVDAKLALVGLPGTASLMPAELSGGMRKRASLSRAIAMDPELLLCDEPSAGLDPIVAAGIDVTMRHLQRSLNMTMIVVTHELASIELIADYVVMLKDGKVRAQGTVAELKQSAIDDVREFFARRPPDEQIDAGQSLLAALSAAPSPETAA